VSWSTSPARTGLDAACYDAWYGFSHPAHASSSLVLRDPRARAAARPDREPRLLRDRRSPCCRSPTRSTRRASIVDAKSGVSGAGRSLKPASHANVVLENVSAYRVGRHQHEPEIAQALGFPVCFVPHLLPIRRGLIATCYVRGAGADEIRARLEAAYLASPAVTVLPEGVTPELSRVQGTDAAEIAVFGDRATDHTIVICAIDNLGKGAAGQAVQNANLALGFPEAAGLRLAGVRV
jgi:N-acetyl-gamma-glutamyl-phosphate reductase